MYSCKGLHTSYWVSFGGGYKRKGTYIEYSKNLIDYLNAYHSQQRSFRVNEFTRSADSMHYYDSILVIEKKRRDQPPHAEKTGHLTFEENRLTGQSASQTFLYQMKLKLMYVLRALGFRSPDL